MLHRTAWKAAVLGTLNVAIQVLAARFIVLIAVGGGIWLTWVSLNDARPMTLGALAIYSVCVVGPSVWLASR